MIGPMFAALMMATVDVALTVGGVPYTAKAAGECNYSTESTIFELPATMWAARQHEGNRNVNFTLWHPRKAGEKGGGDMLTLFVTVGNKTHRVNTVKVGSHADVQGSGQATFEKSGAGGIFTIEAIADTGAKISGRISCSGFVKPEDNGD
jgi:hypothetical protein